MAVVGGLRGQIFYRVIFAKINLSPVFEAPPLSCFVKLMGTLCLAHPTSRVNPKPVGEAPAMSCRGSSWGELPGELLGELQGTVVGGKSPLLG